MKIMMMMMKGILTDISSGESFRNFQHRDMYVYVLENPILIYDFLEIIRLVASERND